MRTGEILDFRFWILDSNVRRQWSVVHGGEPIANASPQLTTSDGERTSVHGPWPVVSGNRQPTTDDGQAARGFTLLELMIVMTLILILASLVTPTYHLAIVRAREAVLRDDLYTLRTLIDQYTNDKQQPPQSLQDLVDAGYLRGGLPVDPFTQSNDTWRVDMEDVPLNPQQVASGIVDVHSGSDEVSSDGETAYSSW